MIRGIHKKHDHPKDGAVRDLVLIAGHGLGAAAARLLGEQQVVDVGHDTTASDGHRAQEARELLVVADGKLDVARHDTGLLVVPRGVPGQLENLVKREEIQAISQNSRQFD